MEVLVYLGLRRQTLVGSGDLGILWDKRANFSQEQRYWYNLVQESQPKQEGEVLLYLSRERRYCYTLGEEGPT